MINKTTCCKLCGSEMVLEEKKIFGLGSDYNLSCQGCQFSQSFSNCSKIGRQRNGYELNQRAVLASRLVGNGLANLRTFCGIMDLPPPVNDNAFLKLQHTVSKAASAEAELSMQHAIQEELKLKTNEEDEKTDSENRSESDSDHHEESKDIDVKGDGTWQKRGFKSLNGAVTVIGALTEKVLDYEVLSSYCQTCTQWQEKHGLPDGEDWEDWYSTHKLVCTKNYSGTSGGMESAGMVRMFRRSEENYNVRYTKYIGDGDAKTYLNIVKAEPYGSNIKIQKLECIGHVGKRFGYQMRQLKTAMKGKKLSDGRGLFGQGRLTNKSITSMQTYYTGAIRNNSGSLCQMTRAIWAIWYHMGSTDEQPQHQFCPVGRHSWCKYQQAAALNEHYHHQSPLPGPIMDAIRPVFVKMTSVTLLKRCLGGQTQNSNESFNSILWKLCPKTIFVRLATLQFGARMATILFNDGMSGILKVMTRLGAAPGVFAICAAKKKDAERLRKAEKSKMEDIKKRRVIMKKLRLNLHEGYVSQEGEDYEAGAF